MGTLPGAVTPALAEPSPAATTAKTRSTWYTPERIKAARTNIDAYAWARTLRDDAVKAAGPLVAAGDDFVWSNLLGQGLPRSYAVNQLLGSPITGTDIFEFGNYPWLADPINKPFQLVDPSSDFTFPTNDFAAFWASALDEHGNFNRELGDPQHLINIRYPEKGPDWGVDDGFGWIDENGDKWTFIAYYTHWFSWYGPTALYEGKLLNLAKAYAFTGDLSYAHTGLIMLDRIADLYPAMDTHPYKKEDGYLASDGLTAMGKAVGCIWETGLVKQLIESYDAFFSAIGDDDAADVVGFLQAKSEQYGLASKASPADIRANIENGILRQVFPAVKAAQIRGNFGMHQSALALAAVVQDDPVASKQWLEFVFQPGKFISTPPLQITGGDVSNVLINLVDRDGFGDETGPNYNNLWIGQIKTIADYLDGYDLFQAADLYQNPKVARLFTAQDRVVMLNRFTPGFGDSGSTGNPGWFGTATSHTFTFEKYRDPVSAQFAYLINGNSVEGLNTGIFAADVPRTQRAIQDVIDEHGPLHLPSAHLSGFGVALLRDGTAETMRGASVYYGRTTGHGHSDALNLGLWAHDTDVLPDHGYPEFADSSIRRIEWTDNTVAHNTVVVDAQPQVQTYTGTPLGFADSTNVKYVDVEAPRAYPQTSQYRRSTAMIRIDAERSYLVDTFRVDGGSQHHYSFHGAEGPVTTEGLDLVAQNGGTYAGPEVAKPKDSDPADTKASGFRWLDNVSRDANPAGAFSLDYDVVDTWNAHDPDIDLHLRATFLGEFDEVALADGEPPRNKPGNPAKLRYLIGKRSGTDLRTMISSVIEPYVDRPAVANVSRVTPTADIPLDEGEVSVIKVELTGDRTDYVVHSLRPDVEIDVDHLFKFTGTFAVYSVVAGKGRWAFMHDGEKLNAVAGAPGAVRQMQAEPRAFTGTITGFTSDLDRPDPSPESTSEVIITPDANSTVTALAAEVEGLELQVANDGVRTAVYKINTATVRGSTVVLDLGPVTLVRGLADPSDPEAGYIHDIAEGQKFRIARQRTWSA
ncbi:heparinase II/III domain-containing protein [Propionibacteriaceae bacterium Y1685]